MSLLQRRLEWQKIKRSGRPANTRVTILSSFTADPLAPYLGLELERAGMAAELQVGPYAQIAQECLNPSSATAVFQPDIVVVWPRLEDLWAAKPLPLTDAAGPYIDDLDDLAATASAVRDWGATLLFVLPAIPEIRPLGVGDANNTVGVFATATAAREAARVRLAGTPGVLIADAEEIVRSLGTTDALDWRRMATARIPYQEAMFAALAERIGRVIRLSRRGSRKVVAVDADNTLWGGIVGEDGVNGIDLSNNGVGEAFRDFQSYLLELRRAGMLLAVVSKNNEDDVWTAFGRPEMRLGRSDLADWRINWEPKSASIAEIAAELNLGTASFVLIDDSAHERAEVTTALPEVRAIEMPSDPALWYQSVTESGDLDRLPPTDADLTRADAYQQESDRRAVRGRTSLGDFFASLDLGVEITRLSALDVSRAAQLIAKTNQFTLAGPRRTDSELLACLDDIRFELRMVSAVDRFGDYGAIGLFIVDKQPPAGSGPSGQAQLDTFVLSCRAMGRGIEQAMAAAAFEVAGTGLTATVHDGPKNAPARTFFAQLGCDQIGVPMELRPVDWPSHIRLSRPDRVPVIAGD